MKKTSFENSKKTIMSGSDNCSTPVIIYNSKGEIALLIQDNAPIWRVLGNGFDPKDNRNNYNSYYKNVRRVLKQETNLPINLRKKAEPLYRFTLLDSHTHACMEHNRVYGLDIGDFPLKSKKGAFIEFFPPDQYPKNISVIHDRIVDEAVKVLQSPKQNEKHLVFETNITSRLMALDKMIANKEEIIGLEKWKNHPAVVAKREAGTLTRDPSVPL